MDYKKPIKVKLEVELDLETAIKIAGKAFKHGVQRRNKERWTLPDIREGCRVVLKKEIEAL